MFFGRSNVPVPENEPVKGYAPGSPERASLKAELARQKGECPERPLVIGGERVNTGALTEAVCPHDHAHVLAKAHQGGAAEAERAINAALEAWHDWSNTSFEVRAAVLLKAAELLSGPWRDRLNAATMLNQGKTCHQAEIDSACELIDFWRFNVSYAQEIYAQQPRSSPGVWNRLDHRPLDGFVYAVAPFNFTAIMANLPTSPMLMGNVCLFKPARSTLHSAHVLMELLEAAGMPPGVINLVTGDSSEISRVALAHPKLAGVHFTGSTATFQHLWKAVGDNIAGYGSYPRLVGETGGKDYVFAHPSADPDEVTTALVRGAFEYQGQKCSAASRAFIPQSLWSRIEGPLIEQVTGLTMGDVNDFGNYMGAVIDRRAFDKIAGYIDFARGDGAHKILAGGESDGSQGYFIRPTVVKSDDPRSKLMVEEIFGPVLTVHVYADAELEPMLDVCDQASPYALTGAVFGRDRVALEHMAARLRHSAGNFYLNDKPTGAVVSQQPFGGGRASGTNDKAGSHLNLLRWISPRTIKETFVPPTDYRYPFLSSE